MTEAIDQTGLLHELSRQCERAGSQSALARKTGIPVSQINAALNGGRQVSEVMANAMGFVRVDRYVDVRKVKAGTT